MSLANSAPTRFADGVVLNAGDNAVVLLQSAPAVDSTLNGPSLELYNYLRAGGFPMTALEISTDGVLSIEVHIPSDGWVLRVSDLIAAVRAFGIGVVAWRLDAIGGLPLVGASPGAAAANVFGHAADDAAAALTRAMPWALVVGGVVLVLVVSEV